MNELATTNPVTIAKFDPAQVLETMVAGGITADNATAFATLASVWERQKVESAKEAAIVAFRDFQRECPPIVADIPNPDALGNTRWMMQDLQGILDTAGPYLSKHGFDYKWTTRIETHHLVTTCTLTHTLGHTFTGEAAARGEGDGADAKATTIGKRLSFLNACGLVVRKTRDARHEGEVVSPQEAADLQRRVLTACTNANGQLNNDQVKRYLRMAGVSAWAAIRRARYDELMNQPEIRGQGGPTAPDTPNCDDPGVWREAMLLAISERWGLGPDGAATTMRAMETSAGKTYLALTSAQRKSAWTGLHAGKLDEKYAPK